MAPCRQEPMTANAEEIERLISTSRGYNALFLAAGSLADACAESPESLTEQGARLLLATLADDRFEDRRTALFFYERFARILTGTARALGPQHPVSRMALKGLGGLAAEATGHRHRAICHAAHLLSSRQAVVPPLGVTADPVPCPLGEILSAAGFPPHTPHRHTGRSLVYGHSGNVLVVKCARPGEDPSGLVSEWHWMRTLAPHLPVGSHIPTPVGGPLLRLSGLPEDAPSSMAIAFLTTPAYFTYPNEPLAPMDTDLAMRVIGQAAFLFGHLAARGIYHTAPVPLFHNRIQTHRRDDEGVYLWQKGGRLDRWLASCRYPNFGLSGLRDLEHIATAPELSAAARYRIMGDQILGLLLVSGSHFRSLKGAAALSPQPDNTDHRRLFDTKKLTAMLAAIQDGYYRGYTGAKAGFPHRARRDELAARMTDEMGQDRHMEEILRTRDQRDMKEAAFTQFLTERGYGKEEAKRIPKGAADIVLFTGPHLGRFNGKISCPELIEFTATLASITIADGFLATGP